MGCSASKVAPLDHIKSIAHFIPLDALVSHGRLPRRGRDEGFRHPLTGQPNANLGKRYDDFDTLRTAYVFVSHRWNRPGQGASGHPDDDANHKYQLILEAVKKLSGTAASPIPEGFQVAVWLECAARESNPRAPRPAARTA